MLFFLSHLTHGHATGNTPLSHWRNLLDELRGRHGHRGVSAPNPRGRPARNWPCTVLYMFAASLYDLPVVAACTLERRKPAHLAGKVGRPGARVASRCELARHPGGTCIDGWLSLPTHMVPHWSPDWSHRFIRSESCEADREQQQKAERGRGHSVIRM